ncbi:hypothetical protein Mpt1_c01100 [Candidatus Methanoplasma termitum]|uniref:Uncharacterized protein n=1 Tax=Candidatus Methanoplasma termitum TaxID=1577791 RepID=A0A0A7LAB4_9ARCH|nr:hypothetical protein [Candidatus Methanoplasma termitum]AIZ56014.1 hypothetical protein Mpt1_c01100 [Candidatus Methanoplasma termitum]MCL2333642.1 hypothetical protein [Candidatus Methanoplasma sp.]
MKKIEVALIVFGVLVIAGSIASIVVMFNVLSKEQPPAPWERDPYYNYYIDYGSYETEILQNGWTGKTTEAGQDPLLVLKELTDTTVDSEGRIISINGVAPDQSIGESWVIWKYDYNAEDYGNRWVEMDSVPHYAFGEGTDYYLGLTQIDPVTKTPYLNPNDGDIFVAILCD